MEAGMIDSYLQLTLDQQRTSRGSTSLQRCSESTRR
ncbi:mCG147888 [Mus musculus]|nr:mCG147888 [Mus musculus]